ncbi:MAG: RDD family protein [Candidatus Thioglobus sp.]|nr:MAG: RDD family protein [Candidatus Thioglobus sp.]KAA0449965.1 MAG: RDD family protein [Candidatus Thioglobus sp.]
MNKSDVSLLRRLGAAIYDVLLAFSLAFVVVGILLIIFFDKQAQTDIWMFFVALLSIYFYFVRSWTKGAQTLGMKAWGFRIAQNNGAPITHKQALLRFILSIVSFSAAGAGFIYQLFNKNNLAFHDKFSGTILLKNQ